MRIVPQDGSIDLTVQFRLSSGQLVDPESPHADLLSPNGSVYLGDLTPPDIERLDVGTFKYRFVVPTMAALGDWTVRWFGTVNGNTASISESFSVVSPGQAQTTAAIVTRLRRLVGERIPLGKEDIDTRFTDQEISDVYYLNNEDLNKAMAELWLAKAAYLSDFVDVVESGTSRALSQLNKAAMVQADRWASKAAVYDQAWAATYRTVGRSFNPYSSDRGTLDRVRSGAVIVVVEDPQRLWSGTGI